MSERNQFLEMDGLYWESETHEWFNDKTSTNHARNKSLFWGSGEQEDALDVMCFVVRNKETFSSSFFLQPNFCFVLKFVRGKNSVTASRRKIKEF